MSTLNEFKKNVLNQDQDEKVSGGVKKLLKLVNKLTYNEMYRVDPFKDLLLDQEFMLSVYSEVKGLDKKATDSLIRDKLPKPDISPYIHYDIYLTERSFIKNIPESLQEFYKRDDYDFDQRPYPFQNYIFDDGKVRMNELYEAYNDDSYSDLSAIQADLKEDLRQHSLRFYIEILTHMKLGPYSTNEVTEDQVEALSIILLWLYGGPGLGEDFMYLIDKSLLEIELTEDNNSFHPLSRYNQYRLNGAKIYFRIYLIDHLKEMKKFKFTGKRVGLKFFLEDYESKKEELNITSGKDFVEQFIHNIAKNIDEDNRSNYKYHHVKAYLETYHYDKSLRSVRSRREGAVKKLNRENKPSDLLNNAGDNVLGNGTERSPGWQKKLDEALGKVG